jgi:thiol-disulfide isomerase/thioredoxin
MKHLILAFVLVTFCAHGQQLSHIYKTKQLLDRITGHDSLYVVNFWATWCKPCVQELPSLDSLQSENPGLKVLLVNLDFAEKQKEVESFLKKKKITSECVLLDEVNGNAYIDLISPEWSGAIPATLFIRRNQKRLLEKKATVSLLRAIAAKF